jgi:hypothetical protein
VLSLTRGRVSCLQLLLALARAVNFGSESRGTRDHVLMTQIRYFHFRRLPQLTSLHTSNHMEKTSSSVDVFTALCLATEVIRFCLRIRCRVLLQALPNNELFTNNVSAGTYLSSRRLTLNRCHDIIHTYTHTHTQTVYTRYLEFMLLCSRTIHLYTRQRRIHYVFSTNCNAALLH